MDFVALPITLATAGALALVNLWLMVRIGAVRRAAGISVGDGGDDRLQRRMRAQANFVENAPFVLALIALIELTHGTAGWLAVAAALFVVARVLHPIGMDGTGWARAGGTLVSMLLLAGLGLYALVLAFTGHHASPAPLPTDTVMPQG